MNLNYVAIIISIVSFAANIVSTVWVSHLNRKHEEKMFMLDFWVKHRAEVLERYVRYTGAFLAAERKYAAINDYLSSYGEALLYIPSGARPTADSLNRYLCDGQFADAQPLFNNLCEQLALDIEPTNITGKKH